ncbi:MAG: flagellar biosynthetic protein FliR [Phycisphaerales bacterium]|nr:flagellar biosynthetic protein FliR [Phycisphaerales bacterium]
MPVELLRFEMLLPAFALVLARVAGLVLAVPMLSSSQIPVIVKVWLVVTLSLMTFPAVAEYLPASLTPGQAVAGMVGEFVVGEIVGFGAGLVFFAAQVGGKIISHQSGMALGTVFNPIFDAEATALDQIWFFTTLLIFLGLRGHLAVVSVLLDSFETVPPMMAKFDGTVADFAVGILRSMFELALRLAGPAIVALLLSSLVMGFLTRTMPQLNILSVGFSVKIAAALSVVALTIAYSQDVIEDALFGSLGQIGLLFEGISERLIHGR